MSGTVRSDIFTPEADQFGGLDRGGPADGMSSTGPDADR